MFNTIFPSIHKEGYKFLAISIIATFIVLLFSKFLGSLLILTTIWIYYFFRDPERYSINDNAFLVSPADGLITDISERTGPMELQLENTTYTKASIFMNVFNCHVNRTPLAGTIEEINYNNKHQKLLKSRRTPVDSKLVTPLLLKLSFSLLLILNSSVLIKREPYQSPKLVFFTQPDQVYVFLFPEPKVLCKYCVFELSNLKLPSITCAEG